MKKILIIRNYLSQELFARAGKILQVQKDLPAPERFRKCRRICPRRKEREGDCGFGESSTKAVEIC